MGLDLAPGNGRRRSGQSSGRASPKRARARGADGPLGEEGLRGAVETVGRDAAVDLRHRMLRRRRSGLSTDIQVGRHHGGHGARSAAALQHGVADVPCIVASCAGVLVRRRSVRHAGVVMLRQVCCSDFRSNSLQVRVMRRRAQRHHDRGHALNGYGQGD
ncbi:MAG: hypothetical protein OEW22_12435 [Rubrivivax sp.]|nr:hypothetical protein [Rubrivivax sp.]